MDDPTNMISRSMELHRKYADFYQGHLSRGLNRTINIEDRENILDEPQKVVHYFNTGSDALRIIIDGLIQALYDPPETILDFPSGSGRVTQTSALILSERSRDGLRSLRLSLRVLRRLLRGRAVQIKSRISTR